MRVAEKPDCCIDRATSAGRFRSSNSKISSRVEEAIRSSNLSMISLPSLPPANEA